MATLAHAGAPKLPGPMFVDQVSMSGQDNVLVNIYSKNIENNKTKNDLVCALKLFIP